MKLATAGVTRAFFQLMAVCTLGRLEGNRQKETFGRLMRLVVSEVGANPIPIETNHISV